MNIRKTETTQKSGFAGLLARLTLAAMFTLAAFSAQAVPILTVDGAGDLGHIIDSNQAAAVSFTLTDSFDDVSITADLTSVGAVGAAFLMTDLGPTAGFGDMVASVDFSNITFDGSNTLLFSGLSLLSAEYALVIASDQSTPDSTVIWNGSSSALSQVTSASGITYGGNFFSADTDAFPASSSFDFVFDRAAHFTVSAGAGSVVEAPEPASWLLIAMGLVGFAFRRTISNK